MTVLYIQKPKPAFILFGDISTKKGCDLPIHRLRVKNNIFFPGVIVTTPRCLYKRQIHLWQSCAKHKGSKFHFFFIEYGE